VNWQQSGDSQELGSRRRQVGALAQPIANPLGVQGDQTFVVIVGQGIKGANLLDDGLVLVLAPLKQGILLFIRSYIPFKGL